MYNKDGQPARPAPSAPPPEQLAIDGTAKKPENDSQYLPKHSGGVPVFPPSYTVQSDALNEPANLLPTSSLPGSQQQGSRPGSRRGSLVVLSPSQPQQVPASGARRSTSAIGAQPSSSSFTSPPTSPHGSRHGSPVTFASSPQVPGAAPGARLGSVVASSPFLAGNVVSPPSSPHMLRQSATATGGSASPASTSSSTSNALSPPPQQQYGSSPRIAAAMSPPGSPHGSRRGSLAAPLAAPPPAGSFVPISPPASPRNMRNSSPAATHVGEQQNAAFSPSTRRSTSLIGQQPTGSAVLGASATASPTASPRPASRHGSMVVLSNESPRRGSLAGSPRGSVVLTSPTSPSPTFDPSATLQPAAGSYSSTPAFSPTAAFSDPNLAFQQQQQQQPLYVQPSVSYALPPQQVVVNAAPPVVVASPPPVVFVQAPAQEAVQISVVQDAAVQVPVVHTPAPPAFSVSAANVQGGIVGMDAAAATATASSALVGLQRKVQKGVGTGSLYLCICQATLPKLDTLIKEEFNGKPKSAKVAVVFKCETASTDISKLYDTPQALWIEVLVENVRLDETFTIDFRCKKGFSTSVLLGSCSASIGSLVENGGMFGTAKLGLTDDEPGDVLIVWQFSEYVLNGSAIISELPPLRIVMERTVVTPGESVSGILSYAVRNKSKEIQSIQLRISGCSSFQTHDMEAQTRPKAENIEFLSFHSTLAGNTKLLPGLYSWKFTFQLPAGVPRTCGLTMVPFFGVKIDYGVEAKVSFVRSAKYTPRYAGLPFTVIRRDVVAMPANAEICKGVIDIPMGGGQVLLQASVCDAHVRPVFGSQRSAARVSVTVQNASKKMRVRQLTAAVFLVLRNGSATKEFPLGTDDIDLLPSVASKNNPGELCTFEFDAPLAVPPGFHHGSKEASRRLASLNVNGGRLTASVSWKVRLSISVGNVLSYSTFVDVPFRVASAPAEYEEFVHLAPDFDPHAVNIAQTFPLAVQMSDSKSPLQDPAHDWARDIGIRTCGSQDKYTAPGVSSINNRSEPEAHCSINWALSFSDERFNFK